MFAIPMLGFVPYPNLVLGPGECSPCERGRPPKPIGNSVIPQHHRKPVEQIGLLNGFYLATESSHGS